MVGSGAEPLWPGAGGEVFCKWANIRPNYPWADAYARDGTSLFKLPPNGPWRPITHTASGCGDLDDVVLMACFLKDAGDTRGSYDYIPQATYGDFLDSTPAIGGKAPVELYGCFDTSQWEHDEQSDAEAKAAIEATADEWTRMAAANDEKGQGADPQLADVDDATAPEANVQDSQQSPAPGVVFRDCPACPEMVVVPAGSYRMGGQGQQHEVAIGSPFAVGRYEVTFAEWDACVAEGGCGGVRPGDSGWGRGDRPVSSVSWDDAKRYAQWLSGKTGKAYRLLSESEWEYAARAGAETAYSWGDEIGVNRANCNGCGSQWDNRSTAPAGSFGANAWGLHDMHGNVNEWVEDCWNEQLRGAPADGSAWLTSNCRRRVLRGGWWGAHPSDLRAASRFYYLTGFRVNHVNWFSRYGTGVRQPPERQGTRWGRGSREPSAGAGSCTTRLSNTHGTAERRILYEFHPWHGQEVALDHVFAKGGVSVAHCRLADGAPSPLLEVPLWMFDRQSCSTVRRRERPHVDLATLEALADLLAAAVRGDGGASVSPSASPSVVSDRQADLRSCDRSQGADHAPVPAEARPVGSVRSVGRGPTSRRAAVARSAGPDAAAGDGTDGSDAVGASRRPGRGSGDRDRRGER